MNYFGKGKKILGFLEKNPCKEPDIKQRWPTQMRSSAAAYVY